MKKGLLIIDLIINWLILVTTPLFAFLVLLDTINAFQDPESYRNVYYQVDWMNEGYWSYIFKNLVSVLVCIIFWISALNKLKGKRLWSRVYYSIWILLAIVATYNLIVNGYET